MIDEQDIHSFMHEFAAWTAAQKLYAEITLDGGSSLLLQTYLRDGASDIDFLVTKLSTASQDMPSQDRDRLFERFAAEHPHFPIDGAYNQLISARIHDGDDATPESLPYLTLTDRDGFGAKVSLAALGHIFSKKIGRIYATVDTNYKKLPSDLCDSYGAYLILAKEWDAAAAKTDRPAFMLGLRPKWELIYPQNVPAPLPENAGEVEAQAARGRKPCMHQAIDLQTAGRRLPRRASLPAANRL